MTAARTYSAVSPRPSRSITERHDRSATLRSTLRQVGGDPVEQVAVVVAVPRDRKPPHSHFLGAPMPFFLEFTPGYGMHQGYLPGEPASHGCIRMPYWKARQFYLAARVGTLVVVRL